MNLLTDKTLIAFEKWTAAAHNICSDYEHAAFFDLPEVCQYALYQEFFDSVGIHIHTDRSFNLEMFFATVQYETTKRKTTEWYTTRIEALQAAILASDGIFNSKI